jgi:hypothetical protein
MKTGASPTIERHSAPLEPESFSDTLYDWMERAPWLAISGAFHLVAFLILAAIPWSIFEQPEERVVHVGVDHVPEPEILEPEEPEEPVEPEPLTEVVPEVELDQPVQSELFTEEDSTTPDGDPTLDSVTPFVNVNPTAIVGIGPGGPPGSAGRFGSGPGGPGRTPGSGCVNAALDWLAAHQDANGGWDADGFMKHDPAGDRTDGPGYANHDIGVTGLALLAFLGNGHTMTRGTHREVVRRGIRWLTREQDRESGLFGEEIGHAFLYDHAIATLAMCETYYLDKSTVLKAKVQRAMNYISRARNPYGVWGYSVPPDGTNDTSVTGWMVLAMKSAEDAGLRVDREAFTAAAQWFDEMTDPGTGRVGYREVGSASSRVSGMNDHFPVEKGEALTSVALLCRFFLGQDPATEPVMSQHADLILGALPRWDPEGFGCDMYHWYYGSYAMFQMGGEHWRRWRKAMEPAVIKSQRKDGAARGSWDPVGPWGEPGGRIYATATMALCLEAYYRYGRILGGR